MRLTSSSSRRRRRRRRRCCTWGWCRQMCTYTCNAGKTERLSLATQASVRKVFDFRPCIHRHRQTWLFSLCRVRSFILFASDDISRVRQMRSQNWLARVTRRKIAYVASLPPSLPPARPPLMGGRVGQSRQHRHTPPSSS